MTPKEDFEYEDEPKNKAPVMRNRKHALLWQSYLWYYEILGMRKTHNQRIKAIIRGDSNMDLQFELDLMEDIALDKQKKNLAKVMIGFGHEAGQIWNWITSIKGLASGTLAAQLITQIDDISRFDTISKLWRFSGYAVFDGKAEPRGKYQAPWDKELKRHYNGRLKGVLFNISDSFIKHQTPGYIDVYYSYKAKQRELHPVAVCRKCKIDCNVKEKKQKDKIIRTYVCPNNARHVKDFSDKHINFRAIRKMMKAFLKDLWLVWREFEGLPISEERF